jgi:putative molybdopterin biosynthesis protein
LAEALASETIPVPDAVGRVLSRPVTAKLSSPNFHAAAMDGIVVKAESTFGASETKPKELIAKQSQRSLSLAGMHFISIPAT